MCHALIAHTLSQDLFRKTIGAVTEAFVVYNSQGNSKGMAVVTFARPTDAGLAKQKYHGKIVDGSALYIPFLSTPRHT